MEMTRPVEKKEREKLIDLVIEGTNKTTMAMKKMAMVIKMVTSRIMNEGIK